MRTAQKRSIQRISFRQQFQQFYASQPECLDVAVVGVESEYDGLYHFLRLLLVIAENANGKLAENARKRYDKVVAVLDGA